MRVNPRRRGKTPALSQSTDTSHPLCPCALSLVPHTMDPNTVKNLVDKLYDKRKLAASDVERWVGAWMGACARSDGGRPASDRSKAHGMARGIHSPAKQRY